MESYLIVQAEYSFRGENNDELCFKKGDLITVTQREDGGWWEGTLDEKTGWFPSNYVKVATATTGTGTGLASQLPLSETIRQPEEIQEYRSVVLNDLLESEKAHVAEIRGLLENFLEPLATISKILTSDEYAQLMCNFVEIVQMHEELLQSIEECKDRVGKLFLSKAPLMKSVHQAYCAAHPRAIVILDKYKDELEKFMERQGAAIPGLLVLTTGLSKPFRRLDKYSAMLQELERHMESGHPDRGDTQRSISVYKDIASMCSATRRQKELELQVLTGPVRGWQGQELTTLGDIRHMGSVAVGPEHRDRYFVLFPQTLLILSVSQRMSAFIYEGKLPLTGITVNRLEDTESIKNAFEVSGPLIEKIIAVCQGPNEANKWVDLLTLNSTGTGTATSMTGTGTATAMTMNGSGNLHRPRPPRNNDLKRNVSTSAVNTNNNNNIVSVPQPPPHMSPGSGIRGQSQISQTHKRSQSFNHHLSYNQYNNQQQNSNANINVVPNINKQQQQQLPKPMLREKQTNKQNQLQMSVVRPPPPPSSSGESITKNIEIIPKANWNITNLRSAPPLRPILIHSSSTSGTSGAGATTASSASTSSSSSILSSSNAAAAAAVGGTTGIILSNYLKKCQPTHEEDALVLRVIEAYCAAYQNTSRNTMHSGLENEDMTPTLKQLWVSVRELQQDIGQIKNQINDERALRTHLQQLLMGHLESIVQATTTMQTTTIPTTKATTPTTAKTKSTTPPPPPPPTATK